MMSKLKIKIKPISLETQIYSNYNIKKKKVKLKNNYYNRILIKLLKKMNDLTFKIKAITLEIPINTNYHN